MSDPNAGSQTDALQFDRAVDAGTPDAQQERPTIECSACHSPIKTYYYNVDGNAVCAKCKHVAENSVKGQIGARAFLKATLFGGVAALLGALIYFGVGALTGYEIGLVAIAIGFMVGYGVRLGANGGGGRRYQVLSLVLTYMAVGLALTGLGVQQAFSGAAASDAESRAFVDSILAANGGAAADDLDDDAEPAGDSIAVALAGESDGEGAAAGDPKELSGFAMVIGLVALAVGTFVMVLAAPLINIIGGLPGGIISAAILAFGLMQAWKMTGGTMIAITGPYKVGGAPPQPTEPATAA